MPGVENLDPDTARTSASSIPNLEGVSSISGVHNVEHIVAMPAESHVNNDETMPRVEDEAVEEAFENNSPVAVLEDAQDMLVKDIDKSDSDVQGALLTIGARVEELERMVGSILRGHSGNWGSSEEGLLLRLADRRGSSPQICGAASTRACRPGRACCRIRSTRSRCQNPPA